MTDKQLAELQRYVDLANSDKLDMYDRCDPYWAASLASLVIATEKLVDVLGSVLEDLNQHDIPTPQEIKELNDVFLAYREASK